MRFHGGFDFCFPLSCSKNKFSALVLGPGGAMGATGEGRSGGRLSIK